MSGQKIVTYRDIAAEAGVDRSTVSLALRGHPRIPPATRERIQAIAQKMGYRPDPMLSYIAASRWNRERARQPAIAYLGVHRRPEKSGTPPDHYLEGIQRRAKALGYIVDCLHPAEFADGRQLAQILEARGIRGVIVGQTNVDARKPDLDWKRFCVVQVGLLCRTEVLTMVCADLRAAIRMAVEEAGRLGFKRPAICYFAHPDYESDRIVIEAAFGIQRERGGPSAFPVFVGYSANSGEYSEKAVQWLNRIRPDVVLGNHRQTARWLTVRGFRIPGNFEFISLVGGGDHPVTEFPGVDLDFNAMGENAVNQLDLKLRSHEYGQPRVATTILTKPVWRVPADEPRR